MCWRHHSTNEFNINISCKSSGKSREQNKQDEIQRFLQGILLNSNATQIKCFHFVHWLLDLIFGTTVNQSAISADVDVIYFLWCGQSQQASNTLAIPTTSSSYGNVRFCWRLSGIIFHRVRQFGFFPLHLSNSILSNQRFSCLCIEYVEISTSNNHQKAVPRLFSTPSLCQEGGRLLLPIATLLCGFPEDRFMRFLRCRTEEFQVYGLKHLMPHTGWIFGKEIWTPWNLLQILMSPGMSAAQAILNQSVLWVVPPNRWLAKAQTVNCRNESQRESFLNSLGAAMISISPRQWHALHLSEKDILRNEFFFAFFAFF